MRKEHAKSFLGANTALGSVDALWEHWASSEHPWLLQGTGVSSSHGRQGVPHLTHLLFQSALVLQQPHQGRV